MTVNVASGSATTRFGATETTKKNHELNAMFVSSRIASNTRYEPTDDAKSHIQYTIVPKTIVSTTCIGTCESAVASAYDNAR